MYPVTFAVLFFSIVILVIELIRAKTYLKDAQEELETARNNQFELEMESNFSDMTASKCAVDILHHTTAKAIRKVSKKQSPTLLEISMLSLDELRSHDGFNKIGEKRLKMLLELVGLTIS